MAEYLLLSGVDVETDSGDTSRSLIPVDLSVAPSTVHWFVHVPWVEPLCRTCPGRGLANSCPCLLGGWSKVTSDGRDFDLGRIQPQQEQGQLTIDASDWSVDFGGKTERGADIHENPTSGTTQGPLRGPPPVWGHVCMYGR